MQDDDDRRGHEGRETRGRGWQGEDDDTQEAHGYRGEGRSWEPPYGDERTYGRQGQRGGSRVMRREGGRYPRGGGSYGQSDYSPSAQSSASHSGYRYSDTGQAGQGGFDATQERGAGGDGGFSGYGSSGGGQVGPGGYPRGGSRGSGYGGDYGQDPYGGGEYIRQSGIGQYRAGEDDHGRGDPSGRAGYEGVYGEGAGRSGGQAPGAGDKYEAYAGGGDADDRSGQHRADFDPHYLEWRRGQLAGYDRDYNHWRETQARAHDEEYHRWRDERRQKFHEDFHGWRQSRSDPSPTASPADSSASGAGQSAGGRPIAQEADPAIRNIADGGEGREDLHKETDRKD